MSSCSIFLGHYSSTAIHRVVDCFVTRVSTLFYPHSLTKSSLEPRGPRDVHLKFFVFYPSLVTNRPCPTLNSLPLLPSPTPIPWNLLKSLSTLLNTLPVNLGLYLIPLCPPVAMMIKVPLPLDYSLRPIEFQ